MKNSLVLLGLAFVMTSAAQAATVECSSKLIFVVGTGGTEARAKLSYVPGVGASGAPTLTQLKGSIEFPDYGAKTFADAAAGAAADAASNAGMNLPVSVNSNGLVGSVLDQAVAESNAGYRPTAQYRNSVQFKDLQVTDMQVPANTATYAEGIMDLTVMVPKSSFSSNADFKLTAEVQIDQNAGRIVFDCRVN